MRLFKKKTIPDESLINFTSTQFDNNSLLVNYSKNISKELIDYSIFGTKKILAPLSKLFDYGVVSLVTILIYNLINNKEFSYY